MRVSITKADKGKQWTYEGAQVFTIGSVDVKGGSIETFYGEGERKARECMSIERLEMLFECGRAEWGNVLGAADDIVRTWGDED